jgi:Family of unknown function (DUF6355)
MNKICTVFVSAGCMVAFAMTGLTLSTTTAMADQCGFYTNAEGEAKYLNCVSNDVIIRVEHQNGEPGEDRCIRGYENRVLGRTTEIKWAWAIGGGHC